MPDFTPAEIQDARENPRSGDVWEHRQCQGTERVVWAANDNRVVYTVFYGLGLVKRMTVRCSKFTFLRWTRNATLLRRGVADAPTDLNSPNLEVAHG